MATSSRQAPMNAAAAAAASSVVSATAARSRCLRERGNTLYREAMAATMAASPLRQSRLQDAIQLYCQALSLSQNDSERAMCCKNLGQAFWSRAKLCLMRQSQQQQQQQQFGDKAWESLCFDLLSSVGYFLEALGFSRPPSQPQEWVQGIHWTLVDIAWTVDDLAHNAAERRSKLLLELCAVFRDKLPPNGKLQASAILHKAAAEQMRSSPSSPDFRSCLELLRFAELHTDASAAAPFVQQIEASRAAVTRAIQLQERRKQGGGGGAKPQRNLPQQQLPPSGNLQRQQLPGMMKKKQQLQSRSFHEKNSDSAELEAMFVGLPAAEFLSELYIRYPPPCLRRGAATTVATISSSSLDQLKSAYRRAISHYHPDHNAGFRESRLSDEITKYLIVNFNGLKSAAES